ncbi:MAG: outer membrane adhesin-like protein [Parcubacteria group bacterium Gr01-1014_3]|nr:MAG: outer membrane adhesin-like protein [Parcubacteria group bacterium Gr01-1014_3]
MKNFQFSIFNFQRWNTGQSLVEVLVAMGVFVISTTAVFFLFYGGQSLNIDGITSQEALNIANEGLEATRAIQGRNWYELEDGVHGLVFQNNEWMFGSTSVSDADGIFIRTVTISTINENTKQASTTITWQTEAGRTQEIELAAQFTKWTAPVQGCVSDPISGNWANPQVLGSVDIGSGNEGTDVAVKLPYAFVSGVSTSAAKPDLFVYNVSNPAAPTLVKSIDIGAGGINSIVILGDYLYAASGNDSKELIVFSIINPVNTAEVGSYNLTGTTDAYSVAAFASSTAIGRGSAAAYELAFLNVSNPTLPTLTSQVAINGSVKDIQATLTKLFAVGQESDEDIWVYDVSNESNPTLLGTHDIAGTTEDLSIFITENGGTTIFDGNEQNELITIGATNTAQMYVRDRINVGGDVNDITCVEGSLVFLATSNTTKEFLIVNATDPDNLVEHASLNFPQKGTGVEYVQNKVYMSVKSNDGLRIVGPGL